MNCEAMAADTCTFIVLPDNCSLHQPESSQNDIKADEPHQSQLDNSFDEAIQDFHIPALKAQGQLHMQENLLKQKTLIYFEGLIGMNTHQIW